MAPRRPGSRARARRRAVRTPVAIDAGTVAARRAQRATRQRRWPADHPASRRSKSSGTSATARKMVITVAPKMAGTMVTPKGADPSNRPARRPIPSITNVNMNTPYRRLTKAIIRQATSRRDMPERRSAQAVRTTPPAPAAANRRVAASPAMVIS